MAMGIYIIRNRIDHKTYVGQSVDITRRMVVHRSRLRVGTHHNLHLQRAWKKYGGDAFEFKVLRECPEMELDVLESRYINLFGTMNENFGYNLEGVVEGSKRRSPEVKAKIAKTMSAVRRASRRPPVSAETRARMAAAKLGTQQSAATVAKRVAKTSAKAVI